MGTTSINVLKVVGDVYTVRCTACSEIWEESITMWAIRNTWRPVVCACGASRAARSLWGEYYNEMRKREICLRTQN